MGGIASKRKKSRSDIFLAIECIASLVGVTMIIGCAITLYRNEAFMGFITDALTFENIIYPTLVALLMSVYILISTRSSTDYLNDLLRERIILTTEVMTFVLVAFYIAITSHNNAGGIVTVISTLNSFKAAAHITNSFITILFLLRLLVNIYCAFSRWDGKVIK